MCAGKGRNHDSRNETRKRLKDFSLESVQNELMFLFDIQTHRQAHTLTQTETHTLTLTHKHGISNPMSN